MTWTYSGDPSASDKDETRFLVGDTDSGSQLISDEEINYLLVKYPSPLSAAAQGARAIAAKLSTFVDEKTGDISVSNSMLAKQFRDLADQLQGQLSEFDIAVFAGGISVSDVDTRNADTDRVDGEFEIGMQDNPNSFITDSGQNKHGC